MSGKKSRDKGKRGEREVATLLRPIYGDGVKRGWQARDGSDAPDIDGTPYWVEVQLAQRVSPHAKHEQGVAATDGRPVAVFTRKTPGGKWLVTMSFDEWEKMARQGLLEETWAHCCAGNYPPPDLIRRVKEALNHE